MNLKGLKWPGTFLHRKSSIVSSAMHGYDGYQGASLWGHHLIILTVGLYTIGLTVQPVLDS